MKLDCEVIEDLLPLYADGVCSGQSKHLVEQHLAGCEACQRLLAQSTALPELPAQDRAGKKSFQKIRTRWAVSVVALLTVILTMFAACSHYQEQYQETAQTMEEILLSSQEHATAVAFLEKLQQGDLEAAFAHIDLQGKLDSWRQREETPVTLEQARERGLAIFCQYGQPLQFGAFQHISTEVGGRTWNGRTFFDVTFQGLVNGEQELLHVHVSADGVSSFSIGSGSITEPLGRFCAWSEYLWQDIHGCYFDSELGEYVYYGQ